MPIVSIIKRLAAKKWIIFRSSNPIWAYTFSREKGIWNCT